MKRSFVNRVFQGGIIALVLLLVFVPVILVMWMSIFESPLMQFPPAGYSLHWYAQLLEEQQFLKAALLSVQIAGATTLFATIVGTAAALSVERVRGREAVETLALAPMAVPGIILGAAIFIFFTQVEKVFNVEIIPSEFFLLAGHLLIATPWVFRLVLGSLSAVDRHAVDAARDLGGTYAHAVWQVILPQIRGAIIAAALFAFIVSFGSFEISLMLLPLGRTTLPIEIANYLSWTTDPLIAAVSTVQIVIVCLLLGIAGRYVRVADVVK